MGTVAETKRPLVIANWKMHGTRDSVAALLQAISKRSVELGAVEVVVCPAYVFLPMVAEQLKNSPIGWGAQDLSCYEAGAHTGDISAEMLRDWACRYVIVGHSERRIDHAESNQRVAEKYYRALVAGLKPVLCVGETLAQREAGATLAVVEEQLDAVFDTRAAKLGEAVIAYEPVWAIGSGKVATAAQAQEVHAFIRRKLASRIASLRIIYGGSVKADNASELFSQPDIDGGLIGGASLEADSFIDICKAG